MYLIQFNSIITPFNSIIYSNSNNELISPIVISLICLILSLSVATPLITPVMSTDLIAIFFLGGGLIYWPAWSLEIWLVSFQVRDDLIKSSWLIVLTDGISECGWCLGGGRGCSLKGLPQIIIFYTSASIRLPHLWQGYCGHCCYCKW